MKYGFVRVAAAVPQVKVADCRYNASQAEEMIFEADENNVQAIVFPELNITGYSCGDLFGQALLLEQAEIALMQLMNNTRQLDIISILGMPVLVGGILYNTAVVIQKGKILGVVPKTYLQNYSEFYEKRWFAPATTLDANARFVSADSLFRWVPIYFSMHPISASESSYAKTYGLRFLLAARLLWLVPM